MARIKKASAASSPTVSSKVSDISSAPAKRVTSVIPDQVNSGNKSNGDLEAAIRARAYQFYEERGRADGLAHEDWVRAEREILSQQGKRTA